MNTPTQTQEMKSIIANIGIDNFRKSDLMPKGENVIEYILFFYDNRKLHDGDEPDYEIRIETELAEYIINKSVEQPSTFYEFWHSCSDAEMYEFLMNYLSFEN